MNNNNKHEISEEKLQRADYYRIQVQLGSREHKILWASVYNFISDKYPDIARRTRDYLSTKVITRLKQDFQTMKDSNSEINLEFREWLKQNVRSEILLREIYDTIGNR